MLTKRQFKNKIIRRNLIVSTTISLVVSACASVEFETSLTGTIVGIVAFVGITMGLTYGVLTELDSMYKEYKDEYEK